MQWLRKLDSAFKGLRYLRENYQVKLKSNQNHNIKTIVNSLLHACNDLTRVLHYRKAIRLKANRPNPRAGLVRPVYAILLGTALCLGGTFTANAPAVQLSAKDYAKYKLQNKSQYLCLKQLIGKESAWNHKAFNPKGPAYGLFQMKSKYVTRLTELQQIDVGLRYIEHRYKTPCKAWTYWQRHYWY